MYDLPPLAPSLLFPLPLSQDPGGKGKDKSKAAAATSFALYEDPEGQPHLPPSLSGKLTGWKRPSEYYQQVDCTHTYLSLAVRNTSNMLCIANHYCSLLIIIIYYYYYDRHLLLLFLILNKALI